MQSALDELQNTLKNAEDYLNGGEKTAPLVRFHIKALQEDSDLAFSVGKAFEELYPETLEPIFKARRIKRSLEQLLIELGTRSSPVASQSDQLTPAICAPPQTKQQDYEMPSFDGDTSKYPAYRDILVEKVINNSNLSSATKWGLLRESLSGPPAEFISEIPQTLEFLDVALKLLDNFYGGADRMISVLKSKFQSLTPASIAAESLRMTHAKLEGILESLAHLNYPINEDEWIQSVYIEKFPSCFINAVVYTECMALQSIRKGTFRLLHVVQKCENTGNSV